VVEGFNLPHAMAGLERSLMGSGAVAPLCGTRMHVPAPWLTLSTNSVVRVVWARDRGAKAVARPSRMFLECMVIVVVVSFFANLLVFSGP